jgi:hypothetical protein
VLGEHFIQIGFLVKTGSVKKQRIYEEVINMFFSYLFCWLPIIMHLNFPSLDFITIRISELDFLLLIWDLRCNNTYYAHHV